MRRARACASVRPACASSGSVKVTHGMALLFARTGSRNSALSDDQPGMIIGRVRKLRMPGGAVADGIDAPIASS